MPRKRGPGFNLTISVPLESLGQSRDLLPPLWLAQDGPLQLGIQAGVSLGTERVKLTHDLEDPEIIFLLCHICRWALKTEHLSSLGIMNFYEASPEFPEFSRVHFADPKMLSPWKVSLLAPAKTFEAFERQ